MDMRCINCALFTLNAILFIAHKRHFTENTIHYNGLVNSSAKRLLFERSGM